MINNKAIELLDELMEYKFLNNHLLLNRTYNSKCMKIAINTSNKIKEIRANLDNLKE